MPGREQQIHNDIEETKGLNGMYVGELTEREKRAFDRLVGRGLARRVYDGAGAMTGLAVVSIDRYP